MHRVVTASAASTPRRAAGGRDRLVRLEERPSDVTLLGGRAGAGRSAAKTYGVSTVVARR